MAPVLRNILFLVSILPLSLAVPTTDLHNSPHYDQLYSESFVGKTRFQRFRDSIIERIWNVPKPTDCHKSGPQKEYTAPADFRKKYGGDVVLRFEIKTEEEARAFAQAASILYLDVWDTAADWADVRVSKEVIPQFLSLLPQSLQNAHTPLMYDFAQAVYDTYPTSSHREQWRSRHNPAQKQKHHHDIFFSHYQPLSVIYPWLDLVAALFPDIAVSFSIGKSSEGRDIPAIRVGAPLIDQDPDDQVRARQTVLVVGGSHAREWISVSTATYLAHSFASSYGEDPRITSILKHYDIIIVPVLNTDGYEYTWGTDRLWRKNRQATTIPICTGIDLDRTYPFQWNGEEGKDNPCTESYAGEYPFQGVEAKVLADWVVNTTRDEGVVFMSYFDLHSYSQKILYPYSYTCDAEPSNIEDLEEAAFGLAKSMFIASGHRFEVSPACQNQFSFTTEKKGEKVRHQVDEVNNNGGSSLDYFYEVLRMKYAYQIKLQDTGTYGFLLPSEYIVPSGQQMFDAMVRFGHWLLSNRGIEMVDDGPTSEEPLLEHSQDPQTMDEWSNRDPEYLFNQSRNPSSPKEVENADTDDGDEWERVYDEELRRRRR